ncbi:unnamed protein product [Brassica oleracea]
MLLYRGFEKPKERDCTAKKCISKMSQICLYGRVFALLFQVRGNFVKPLKKQEEMWETNMTHKIKLWYLTFVGKLDMAPSAWVRLIDTSYLYSDDKSVAKVLLMSNGISRSHNVAIGYRMYSC